MKPYAYLMAAIFAEILATSSLKAANGFTRPLPSMLVVAVPNLFSKMAVR